MKTNEKGTAVAVQATESNNTVVTAVVVSKPDNGQRKAVNIASDLIEPSNYNARKTFDADALKELAQSISVHGLIQPITVRRKGEKGEHYEIICGERRFRACRMLKLAEIPCIVREVTDEQAYDLSISENLQREDVPPIEAAEAYKRLIDTKRYDVASLALQFGKSDKHVYQTLKLCELIKGIANLVKAGKLTASAGIVISKYDKKIQAEILKDRLGEDGQGDWCSISAGVLDGKIQSCYTNNLMDYHFDKTPCLKCIHNSTNFDLFATGSGCGRCADKKCLDAKNTAYLVAQAEEVALHDPKLVFIGEQYGYENEATRKIRKGGYEFKNVHTYNLNRYPTAPTAPQASEYKKTEDFDKAQEKYGKEQEKYTKQTAHLDELKEQGKIRVYAEIGDKGVKLHYKEVATKDTKTNEQLIADLTAKKKRNTELQAEKTAEGIKELLRTDEMPQSAFTAAEETAMYFFMLSKLRRSHYKTIGLKENDYYGLTDEKRLQIASTLTEEQKTVIRRDYLYSHLTDRTTTVADTKGGIMLAFAKQHLPKKTAEIEATHAEDYGKKNARLDERIAGLKEAEKKAKADAKAKKAEQPAKAEKTAKTNGKTAEKAKKATTPTVPATVPAKNKGKEQPKATASTTTGTVHIVTVPPKGKTAEVATAV
ncbi:ParB/RepB/Spo0J family partition protein [Barnesiella propionica]|uniref:ParB/RepB/Spo0J family partition protein n=1 Tax=Barnesiella propionica TaxID=2981781 RepID=UPI0011CB3D9F|nr:ParB/RepB/Spo0J family partition protein [Barnesiella propionica]MCU6769617.1 ParB/RepB/Spo0J family partition protein [Barnesiella propionica]